MGGSPVGALALVLATTACTQSLRVGDTGSSPVGTLDTHSTDSTVDTADSGGTLDTSDTGATGGPDDTSDTGDSAVTDTDTATDTDPGEWCVDFESGQLSEVGYVGSHVVLGDGAILTNVTEGDDFSGLTADDQVLLEGDHALLMRSSEEGAVDTVAIATTAVWTVASPDLMWLQLSEVDERGVVFAVDVLSPDSNVLASAILPVVTGGHVPGLESDGDALVDFPEIVIGGGVAGVLAGQAIDLSPWLDLEVKVRFYQHTLSDGNGFFTLLDDLCTGTADRSYDRIPLGEPSDRW